MQDYKDAVIERFEDYCFEFEDKNGREPTEAERLQLWKDAEEYVVEKACAYADYLRKQERGE